MEKTDLLPLKREDNRFHFHNAEEVGMNRALDFSPRRRRLALGAIFGSVINSAHLESSHAQDSNEQEKQEWMGAIMGSKAFGSPSVLSKFSDGIFYLRGVLSWKSSTSSDEFPAVRTPKGFVTDLTSIPRPFWSLLPRDGKYADAAIIHDYLYWEQTTSKNIADQILARAMRESEVSNPVINVIMAGVQSWFGDDAWSNNSKLRSKGERRVLKKFPLETNISWQQWKKDQGNFI